MRIKIFLSLIMFSQVIFGEPKVLVLANESMPYNGVDPERDKPVGMIFEVLETVASYGGPQFEYMFGIPWKRAQIMLEQAEDSLVAIVPLTRNIERESSYTWIAKLLTHQGRLSAFRDTPFAITEVKDRYVGIIRGSGFESQLKGLGINKLVEAHTALDNARKLYLRRIDAIFESQYVDTYHWKMVGGSVKDLSFTPYGNQSEIYIAGNNYFPLDVADQIQIAIHKMGEEGALQVILDRWNH